MANAEWTPSTAEQKHHIESGSFSYHVESVCGRDPEVGDMVIGRSGRRYRLARLECIQRTRKHVRWIAEAEAEDLDSIVASVLGRSV